MNVKVSILASKCTNVLKKLIMAFSPQVVIQILEHTEFQICDLFVSII